MPTQRMQSTRRWLTVALAVALLLGVVWYRLHSTSPHSAQLSPAHPAQREPAAHSAMISEDGGVLGRKRAGVGDKETVVCGVGGVELTQSDRVAPFNYVSRMTEAARSRWRRTLVNSDDYHERAAGLLLESTGWNFDPTTNMPTRTHDAELARDELVQLAAGLHDLTVYAMALRACDPADDGGVRAAACERISLAEWANMDSGNAAPWLEMAAAAYALSDRGAEFAAVSRAINAHTVDFYNDSLLVYSEPGMPPETTELERAAFFDGLIGHVGGDGHVHAFATGHYCTSDSVQQSSIHEQCEAIAELLADHGRNTFDLSAAATIGTRVGWPSERITAVRQEILAIYRIESHSDKNPWSCDNVRAVNEFEGTQAQSGEIAAGRAAILKSGKSIAELAQEQLASVQSQ